MTAISLRWSWNTGAAAGFAHNGRGEGPLLGDVSFGCAIGWPVDGLSFFDPHVRSQLGTYFILEHIGGRPGMGLELRLYGTYWVQGSPKMAYKERSHAAGTARCGGWERVER